jgi:hypothetical protein
MNTVLDLINVLPGNSSVNTVQQAAKEKAVFSVDHTDMPIDWLDRIHVICVYCRSMSIHPRQLQVVVVVTEAHEQAGSKLEEYRRVQEVSL